MIFLPPYTWVLFKIFNLQAFGFCEYNNPDAGLRAIRLLNNFNIADKSLVVKVDAKTRKILEEYVTERIKRSGDNVEIPKEDEIENYVDEDIKYDDDVATDRIKQILVDHAKEIDSYVPKVEIFYRIFCQF